MSVSNFKTDVILYLSTIYKFIFWSNWRIFKVLTDWLWYWNDRPEWRHKTITSVVTFSTYTVGFVAIIPIMYVSTFTTAVILYIYISLDFIFLYFRFIFLELILRYWRSVTLTIFDRHDDLDDYRYKYSEYKLKYRTLCWKTHLWYLGDGYF